MLTSTPEQDRVTIYAALLEVRKVQALKKLAFESLTVKGTGIDGDLLVRPLKE